MNENSDNISLIRAHLQEQSTEHLVDLLIDLVRAVDEPLRQRFWDRLAPPAMATADLRYASPQTFLTELQEFEEAVMEGIYFDDDALEYFGEDPFDREYNREKYGWLEDFDPDDHQGLNALGEFLTEADSYFQAKQYDMAAEAYAILINIFDGAPEDTLGIYDPLSELGGFEEAFAQRYFVALKESCSAAEFYEAAISYLARHDAPYRKHMDNFMALVGPDGQDKVRDFLKQWADELAQTQIKSVPIGIPFQLRLLMRFYTEANRQHKVNAIQKRFRHMYLAFYEPLLAEREVAHDWQAVIDYGQEVLTALPAETVTRPYFPHADGVDADQVRTQMAYAYEALGDLESALYIYQPVFDRHKNFEHYALVKRLATGVNPSQGQSFTADVIGELLNQLPHSLFFPCQVYLSEDQFDAAYALVEQQNRYNNLDAIKLVAKAHLLAGFGPKTLPEMGPYLHDLYAKIEQTGKEPTLFLRDHLPPKPALDRETAVARAEYLYRNLMQMHIDNGRKTYAIAAYYCALLGEIAAHDGRATEFKQYYQDLLNRYPRHRALRRELAAKVDRAWTE